MPSTADNRNGDRGRRVPTAGTKPLGKSLVMRLFKDGGAGPAVATGTQVFEFANSFAQVRPTT